MNDTEIIICTESGYLEAMSELLVWSLRNFGGVYKDTPVYSYQPRKSFKISKRTERFFEDHKVKIIDENLNSKFPLYPLANKPLAAAHRESRSNAKNLIFLDSDIFFLNEPANLLQFDDCDLILRPVDHKNIGIEHFEDANATYWRQLYELLDISEIRRVRTTGSNEEILEYYNSGHIVTRRETGLFNQWKENFLKVMQSGLKPTDDLFYVEQSVFSATVTQMKLKVKLLEDRYNHPISFLKSRSGSMTDFVEPVSIHYHKDFINENAMNPIENLLKESQNGRMINQKLKEFGLIKKSNGLEPFIYRLKRRYKRLQMLLNRD